ncbi:hypothetical protein R7127_00710 [Vibrio sp. 1159]|nr:hypothetical protein [Vibrio sp. 1159]MDW2318802.1 hypothetical protein [Vibrio sp. 1159]
MNYDCQEKFDDDGAHFSLLISHSERGRSGAFSGGYAAGRRVVNTSDTG